MKAASPRNLGDVLARLSRGLTAWILGPGLLSFHVGIYLLAVVGLLLWNLFRSPAALWVDEPLRRWGLVVVFHATAVAAGWIAWRLLQVGPPTSDANSVPPRDRDWSGWESERSSREPQPHPTSPGLATTVWAAGSVAEERARRWLQDSVRAVRETLGSRLSQNGHADHQRDAAGLPSLPWRDTSVTEWSALFTRRARDLMASARDYLPTIGQDEDGTTSGAPMRDPTSTWPVAKTDARRSESSAFRMPDRPESSTQHGIREITPQPPASVPDPLLSAGPIPRIPASELDPLKTAAEAGEALDADGSAAMDDDARWAWVEAAAAAWLARRENEATLNGRLDGPAPPAEEPPAASP